jgi:hypothetical protein
MYFESLFAFRIRIIFLDLDLKKTLALKIVFYSLGKHTYIHTSYVLSPKG